MDILIKGRGLPKSCKECGMENQVPNCPYNVVKDGGKYDDKRHQKCPLEEVDNAGDRAV